jgi:hypothetical protein
VRVFAFDPATYRDHYAAHGWVYIPSGIDPGFLPVLREGVERAEQHRVSGAAIGGRKQQALFEFPPEVDFPDELFDVVAEVCALNRPTMTLSERHIKVYEDDAPPEVPPHKDRYASQVSVGLSIDIPRDSRLVLYPSDDVGVNPHNVSAALRTSLEPHQLPEVVLRDAREVEIDDAAGDVVMFAGSAIWHMRRNQASARNLYLKFNDFGCDPLGEDPNTDELRRQTIAALALEDAALAGWTPVAARRLDTLTREHTRNHGPEILAAHLLDEKPVALSELEFSVARAATGEVSVDSLARSHAGAVGAVRHLAERGVLDLLPAPTGAS